MKNFIIKFCALATIFSLATPSVLAREPGGIWKYAAPPDIRGEFEKHDPVGLIAGALIPTDCSMNWLSDDGRIYCFTTGISYVHFMKAPRTNQRRAAEAWAVLGPDARMNDKERNR